jgi:hypothetical protein
MATPNVLIPNDMERLDFIMEVGVETEFVVRTVRRPKFRLGLGTTRRISVVQAVAPFLWIMTKSTASGPAVLLRSRAQRH